jgi:hypothetical protein
MLKRPKSDGRCIHCREVLIKRTKDHVFPSSWYPDSTPPTVQRWTAPSCERCNGEFGEMEKELFVRLALCVDPRKPAAQGLSERAVRSFGVDVQGISEEERRHREALRDKIRGEMKPYTPDIEPHILPGLGPHPELPAGEQIRIDIQGTWCTRWQKRLCGDVNIGSRMDELLSHRAKSRCSLCIKKTCRIFSRRPSLNQAPSLSAPDCGYRDSSRKTIQAWRYISW